MSDSLVGSARLPNRTLPFEGVLPFRVLRRLELPVSVGPSFDAKEQVRQATDIVDLIGGYLQLRREGRGYKALCPWHDDSRPSLQVNPERQTFRCFVCDIGGDVFSFMMKKEGITFPEALAMLAERAGITVKGAGSSARQDEKRLLYQAMAWAEEQFHQCLQKSPEAEAARQYLLGRGIQPESFAKYRLGYSPESWGWLIEQAQGTRYTPKMLETIGLVAPKKSGQGFYDRFRGRVLFSIRDVQGRPVGLGGRVLPGSDQNTAKYINSPETPLFSKSSLLYALDHAKDAFAKTRTALVMEGYTDCLVAQQCGFGHAVAVLGTALGDRHLSLLRRYVDRIVLVLDGDEAGRRRTDQILELFVAEQMDLRVLTLPDGLDPCDFLLQRGAEEFGRLIDGALDALEHKFQSATRGIDLARDTHAANRAVEEVLATLAKSPRLQASTTMQVRLREQQLLTRTATHFGLPEERLRARLTELRRGGKRAPQEATALPEPEVGKLVLAEKWLLQILLQAPETIGEIRRDVTPVSFRCPRRRELFARCCALADRGVTPTFDRMILEIDDPDLKSLLVALDEQREGITPAALGGLLSVFREDSTHAPGSSHAPAPGARAADEAAELDALRRLVSREQRRQGISAPTDG